MISRRGFLGLMGAMATAALLGCESKTEKSVETNVRTASVKFQNVPWPYEKLDPNKVADLAYESYMHHCMYGVVNAVVGSSCR